MIYAHIGTHNLIFPDVTRTPEIHSILKDTHYKAATEDKVNSPSHYKSEGGIECIEAIRAALTPEEFRGYCKGNILKYTWRERKKGGDESLAKAQWYMKALLDDSHNQ